MTKKDIYLSFEGKRLNGYLLHVQNLSSGRFPEETNFVVFLKAKDGTISKNVVVKGKYFAGRGKFYKPWLEKNYNSFVQFNSSKMIALSENSLDEKLFNHLLKLLPPGSHIMVVYSNHKETKEGLNRGFPAVATSIGYLLWKSGCKWFKNWYYSEGFWEGDIKLQGNKPLNIDHRKKNLLEICKELTELLKTEQRSEKLFKNSRKRATELLKYIKS